MSSSSKSGGIGVCGALFIVFVVLKLTGTIVWSWVWVASPLWIPLCGLLAVLVVCLGGYGLWVLGKVLCKGRPRNPI